MRPRAATAVAATTDAPAALPAPTDITLAKLRFCKILDDALEDGESLRGDYVLSSRNFCNAFTTHHGEQFEADCHALARWVQAALLPHLHVEVIRGTKRSSKYMTLTIRKQREA